MKRSRVAGREAAKAGKISPGNGRRGFHLHTDDASEPVLDHDVDFVTLLVAKVRECVTILSPARQLHQFAENEGLENGPELCPVEA